MLVSSLGIVATVSADYGDALSKCILFFEGQRSGYLPRGQRMTWRMNSGLKDGSDIGMDLTGGYYDAGDNVKFTFPMAFTVTNLAWSVIEFGQFMGSEKQNALQAILFGTDFLLKATDVSERIVAQVGDGFSDHNCWERPEDMDTLRTSYVVNASVPGSDLAAEIAAALASASMAFQSADAKYSKTLLERAIEVFDFADKYRKSYNGAMKRGDSCPFYCSLNGYMDELVWGAAWLYRATKSQKYWDFVQKNINDILYLGPSYGWDAKQGGVFVLFSQFVMNNAGSNPFVTQADNLVCSLLPNSPTQYLKYTPGGLLTQTGQNLQLSAASSLLILIYAQYLKSFNRQVHCGNVVADASKLIQIAKGQADYILGKNPLGMSYMVGYGNKFPQRIHHRASSLPSIKDHPQQIKCKEGTPWYQSKKPNPNLLTGALPGGPINSDKFSDDRNNAPESEPTTYLNAFFVGVLAYFKGNPN
ncbi:hypothetical protein SLE2022_022820 [Rubroshorea leprosula]